MEERQTAYTIGESFELPSKGSIYDKRVNQHVELRSMTARDEMKRLNPSSTPLKTLADIIEGCMIEKPAVHVYDMALGDYEFLLHKLRIISYGKDYKISGLVCPHCGEEIDTSFDLDSLEVKDFNLETFESYRQVTLPVSGHLVTLKYQTPRTSEDIEIKAKEYKRKFKNAELDFNLLSTLVNIIDTVDGNTMMSEELENFVQRLPVRDMNKILNNYEKLNKLIGVDNNISIDCPSCGGEVLTFFRFGPEFFRPTED